ncbi:MAG: TIGR02147 family protein [Bacteriovoracaceae bacterium]
MQTEVVSQNPANTLKQAYLLRKERNHSYSLNAFAQDLGVSKSFLSRVLSGERPVSMKLAIQISVALDLNEAESRSLLFSVIQFSSKNAKISKKVKARIQKEFKESSNNPIIYTTIDLERFKVMSHWYHFALINLTRVKGFRSTPTWIAKKLGITVIETRDAIERLISLGLMREVNGSLKASSDQFLNVKTQKSNLAIRNFHEQMIAKARDELKKTSTDAFNHRLINGITFTCTKDQIEMIKNKIDQFQDEILTLTGSVEGEELYQMNVQLFPLLKNGAENEN